MSKIIKKEKIFYDKFWKNLKGGYSGDNWHFSSQTPYPVIFEFITFLQKEKIKDKFLDLGCGNGRQAIPFAQVGLKSCGIDFSEEAVILAKKNAKINKIAIDFQVGDVLNLPYKNKEFGVILDSGCLHHLRKYQWREYLRNLNHVLKSDGYFFLICFSINSDRNIKKFTRGLKVRNWSLKNGHYNHLFYDWELEKLFQKDFVILKKEEMQKGDYPLKFWVFWMRKR
jgi:SAM-dependent methyltransferase